MLIFALVAFSTPRVLVVTEFPHATLGPKYIPYTYMDALGQMCLERSLVFSGYLWLLNCSVRFKCSSCCYLHRLGPALNEDRIPSNFQSISTLRFEPALTFCNMQKIIFEPMMPLQATLATAPADWRCAQAQLQPVLKECIYSSRISYLQYAYRTPNKFQHQGSSANHSYARIQDTPQIRHASSGDSGHCPS